MGKTLATMFTISTYGTWLRGDARGWVDEGIVFPERPALSNWDRARMKHPPYFFPRDQWLSIGQAIGDALVNRLGVRLYALTVQSWHSHGVIGATRRDIADVIKCAKDAVRWHLRVDGPIWAVDYDKRWCFDWSIVGTRIVYVRRHNRRNGWEENPWGFLKTPEELADFFERRQRALEEDVEFEI